MKVMHYYTYPENAGGPLTYIKNILESNFFKDIEFAVCYQNRPASKIRKKDIKRIINEIKSFSPDILHIHGVQSEGFIGTYVGKKAKVPHILMTVHGLQIDAQNISVIKKMIFKHFIEPYALKNVEAVYCVCDKMTERQFIKKYSRNLLPTIHNFISDKFLNMPIKNNINKANKIIITTVSRISFDKGMYELEEIIRRYNNDNIQYWIIGTGEYENAMKKNLSMQIDSGKVIFWGHQPNVKSFLAKSDIFLFLSHHENLSIALLEAASQKCCCIATDVGGNSEIITNNTEGILIPPMDTSLAIKSLKKVIKDKDHRLKLGENLYKKITYEYSENLFGKKLLSLYLDICEQRNEKNESNK